MSIGGGSSSTDVRNKGDGLQENFGYGGSYSTSGSMLNQGQGDAMQNLWGMTSNMLPQAQNSINQYTGQLMSRGNQTMDSLRQLGDPTANVNAQLQGLNSGLQDLWSYGDNKIGDQAIAAGAFGGARHGLQQAALGGEIGDAYTRGYGDIMANASNQSINANAQLAQMLPTMFNLGMGGQFGALQAAGGIFGPGIMEQFSESNAFEGDYGYTFDKTRNRTDTDGSEFNANFGEVSF